VSAEREPKWGFGAVPPAKSKGKAPGQKMRGTNPPPPEAEEVFIFQSLIFDVYVILLYCVLHLVKSD